jgi:hypothetical protein
MLENKIKRLLEKTTQGKVMEPDDLKKELNNPVVKELMNSHANMAKQTLEREKTTTVDYNYKRDPNTNKSNYQLAVEALNKKKKQGGK